MASTKKPNPQPAELIFSRSNSTTTGATRRHFHWSSTTNKVTTSEELEEDHNLDSTTTLKNQIHTSVADDGSPQPQQQQMRRKKVPVAVSKIRSVVMSAITTTYAQYKPSQLRLLNPRSQQQQLGTKVIGTLFGRRKGHVNFVFQKEHNTSPVFFVELATSITSLVKEMASGLVRIALECDKVASSSSSSMSSSQQQKQQVLNDEQEGEFDGQTATSLRRRRKIRGISNRRREGGSSSTRIQLVEEVSWRAYCNGKKCGFAVKKEPGPKELKILKAVEPISMGAGVLPGFNGEGLSGPDGELMYMRAKFERVVGSRDSEAFYMMNPDSNGAPELSLYLLRL